MDSCSPGRADSQETISPASTRSMNFVHWSRFQAPATLASDYWLTLATVGVAVKQKAKIGTQERWFMDRFFSVDEAAEALTVSHGR
jgi:hypothetical protein